MYNSAGMVYFHPECRVPFPAWVSTARPLQSHPDYSERSVKSPAVPKRLFVDYYGGAVAN